MDSVGRKRKGIAPPAVRLEVRSECGAAYLTLAGGPSPSSVGLKTRRAKYGTCPLDQLVVGGHDVLEGVPKSELMPLVPAHLVERQDVNSFDVAKIGGVIRDLFDVSEIVGQPRHQNVAHPDRPPTRRQAAGKRESRANIHACQMSMAFGIPRFDVEHYEIDVIQLRIGEAIAVIAVGVQRGVCTLIDFAAAKSLTTNRCCISGSPPLMVRPPDMIFSP